MQLEHDADMAAEMAQFTRDQIMSQASISMLAQANQSTMAVLKLLGWDSLIHFCKKGFSSRISWKAFSQQRNGIFRKKNTLLILLIQRLLNWAVLWADELALLKLFFQDKALNT